MSSEVIILSEVSQFQEVRARLNKNLLDEVKEHSRASHDVQFKEFSPTKKIRPRMVYEWTGKIIFKKSDQKN